jgi:transglutaminase-like putative cysteine protease
VVETAAARPAPPEVGWDELTDPALRDRFAELLVPSRYVVAEPEVDEVAARLRAAHPPVEAGRHAVGWVHDTLDYVRGATQVGTTSAEARAGGKGVCQDFSHLALAVLRAAGLPARYVSGYLHPSSKAEPGHTLAGQSHAWIEAWVGDWMPFDPTNGSPVGERHVVVGRARDYADLPPLNGIFHGGPAKALGVSVELTRLA